MDQEILQNKKIAILHDFLSVYGGAEVVLQSLLEAFPHADLYTGEFRKPQFEKDFLKAVGDRNVYTSMTNDAPYISFLNKVYSLAHKNFFQNLDLGKYDIVIVSSSGFAKWADPKHAFSIVYIHTPPRFIWGMESSFFSKLPNFIKSILSNNIEDLRKKDKQAVERFDEVIANAKNIQDKIYKFYEVDCKIIYPPVILPPINYDTSDEDYYLIINRLVSYKHIDKIIEYFNNDTNKKLVIIGDGPERSNLEKMIASDNIELLGFVSNEEKYNYLSDCKALIYPGEEDFGIAMVEAFSFGKPVLALNRGGAQELVSEDRGVLFETYEVDELDNAIMQLETSEYNSAKLKEYASTYSNKVFKKSIIGLIDDHFSFSKNKSSNYSSEND